MYYQNLHQLFSSGFSPNNLPNLAAWYKSDVGITLSGSEVTGWADQSGNGRDLSASFSSPNRPTVVATTLNGYPVIKSNPTTQSGLATAAAFPDHSSTGLTIFIVGLQEPGETSDGNTYHHFLGTGNPIGGGNGFSIQRNFTFDEIQGSGIRGSDLRAYPLNGVPYSIRLVVKTSPIGNTFTINNGGEASGDGVTVIAQGSNLRVFDGYFAERIAKKQIAEIIIYLRDLSSTEITTVETYIQNKYGIKNGYATLMNGASFSADVPTPISGNVYSVALDGVNDKIVPLNHISITNSSSLSFWVKHLNSSIENLFINSVDGTPYISIQHFNPSIGYVNISSNIGNVAAFQNAMATDNAWYHIAITRDASANYNVYLNGTVSSSGAQAAAGAIILDTIGGVFNGKIADVRFYNSILSGSDISALAAGTATSADSALHLKLNDNNGILAKDTIT